jgi:hypothetical protein
MGESMEFSSEELLAGRFCIGCGYSLRGIDSERCPECGTGVDHEAAAISVIPWTHRGSLGWWRAYLRTVKLAILHPAKLAHEIGRPANFADAVLFRRLTAGLATVSMIALSICLICVNYTISELSNYYFEIAGMGVLWACVWFFFLTVGGVVSYWFHPKIRPIDQQNRAIAISYYACASLALTPIAVALLCTATLLGYLADKSLVQWSSGAFDGIFFVGVAGGGLLLGEFGMMLTSATRLLRRTTYCSGARSISCWIGLPISWMILAGVFLIALPGVYIFVALMILSFH